MGPQVTPKGAKLTRGCGKRGCVAAGWELETKVPFGNYDITESVDCYCPDHGEYGWQTNGPVTFLTADHCHFCPECYEYKLCHYICEFEPDLGTYGGLPLGYVSDKSACNECKGEWDPAAKAKYCGFTRILDFRKAVDNNSDL